MLNIKPTAPNTYVIGGEEGSSSVVPYYSDEDQYEGDEIQQDFFDDAFETGEYSLDPSLPPSSYDENYGLDTLPYVSEVPSVLGRVFVAVARVNRSMNIFSKRAINDRIILPVVYASTSALAPVLLTLALAPDGPAPSEEVQRYDLLAGFYFFLLHLASQLWMRNYINFKSFFMIPFDWASGKMHNAKISKLADKYFFSIFDAINRLNTLFIKLNWHLIMPISLFTLIIHEMKDDVIGLEEQGEAAYASNLRFYLVLAGCFALATVLDIFYALDFVNWTTVKTTPTIINVIKEKLAFIPGVSALSQFASNHTRWLHAIHCIGLTTFYAMVVHASTTLLTEIVGVTAFHGMDLKQKVISQAIIFFGLSLPIGFIAAGLVFLLASKNHWFLQDISDTAQDFNTRTQNINFIQKTFTTLAHFVIPAFTIFYIAYFFDTGILDMFSLYNGIAAAGASLALLASSFVLGELFKSASLKFSTARENHLYKIGVIEIFLEPKESQEIIFIPLITFSIKGIHCLYKIMRGEECSLEALELREKTKLERIRDRGNFLDDDSKNLNHLTETVRYFEKDYRISREAYTRIQAIQSENNESQLEDVETDGLCNSDRCVVGLAAEHRKQVLRQQKLDSQGTYALQSVRYTVNIADNSCELSIKSIKLLYDILQGNSVDLSCVVLPENEYQVIVQAQKMGRIVSWSNPDKQARAHHGLIKKRFDGKSYKITKAAQSYLDKVLTARSEQDFPTEYWNLRLSNSDICVIALAIAFRRNQLLEASEREKLLNETLPSLAPTLKLRIGRQFYEVKSTLLCREAYLRLNGKTSEISDASVFERGDFNLFSAILGLPDGNLVADLENSILVAIGDESYLISIAAKDYYNAVVSDVRQFDWTDVEAVQNLRDSDICVLSLALHAKWQEQCRQKRGSNNYGAMFSSGDMEMKEYGLKGDAHALKNAGPSLFCLPCYRR